MNHYINQTRTSGSGCEAHTVPFRQIVALSAAFLLAVGPAYSDTSPLGIVTHAERAHVGEATASEGSTIYEGERLSTEPGGVMRSTSHALILQLEPQSIVTLRRAALPQTNLVAELASGTLVFSTAATGNIVVVTNDALIRPAKNLPCIVHIRIVSRRELRIDVKRGAVEFSYHGDAETIREGASYRVLLDPSDTETRALSETDQTRKKPFIHHTTFLLVAVAAAVGVAIPILMHAFESPNKP